MLVVEYNILINFFFLKFCFILDIELEKTPKS